MADLYRSKVVSADEAVKIIQSGQRVYSGGGSGAPRTLLDALVRRASALRDVEMVHVLIFGPAPHLKPEYAESFRHRALFIGENARAAVQAGRADFMPIFLSEIPGLFRNGALPLDVALIQVSPPDEHGFCSFGCEVGCTKPAAQAAKIVIAEVNRKMPRVLGDSFIHFSKFTHVVEADYALPEAPQGGASPVHETIGKIIAEMIPDGATLQLGVGSIPDAVLAQVGDKKDLGIHTELFSDGVIDLVNRGVITNEKKTLHPGKIVAGFLFGSQRLYDFVQDNAMIELHPTDYVNDPFIIAQNDNMISINSAIEVDLTGQVCADSIGAALYSGIGGQVDFVRGAARSRGGKPIIALPADAKDGKISRIVPQLKPGAGVVTSRGDVHYIVTEFGVAYLYGKSVRERVCAMIAIAAPQFRAELEKYAKQNNYI
ncbi:MAG: acetyl-CoA hydrolase/transferase family protein [Chloroflexi bacterium]|nr:acetyl-CoA hydrolase/transferase family protein [Chloroflexota bacterium]